MSTPAFDHRRSLQLLRSEVADLNRRIAMLSPEQWQQESSCAGWHVADLVMHVVRNGEAFLDFTKGILAGDGRQARGFAYPDAREASLAGPAGAPRDVEIRDLGPGGCAELQAQQLEEYATLLAGLSDSEMEKTGWWAGCQRTIAWGCSQRFAEVACHHWDLRRSLGEDEPLPDAVGSHLLAYRMDPVQSPMFRYRPADGAALQTFRFRSTTDGASWRVSVSPASVPATELGWAASERPRPGRRLEPDASGAVDIELAAESGWLALATTGRGRLDSPHFQMTGPPDASERFVAAFSG